MIINKETITFEHITDNLIVNFSLNDIVFFDIETTGLSSSKHLIYLIGCLYLENNKWTLTQWLATCLEDEKEIINEFNNIISSKNTVLHFNGTTFDMH